MDWFPSQMSYRAQKIFPSIHHVALRTKTFTWITQKLREWKKSIAVVCAEFTNLTPILRHFCIEF